MMNENRSGTDNLLDTTDCLEAVGVFKGWKNFFFLIIVLCILLLQACFWFVDLGMIEVTEVSAGTLGGQPNSAIGADSDEQDSEINDPIKEPNEQTPVEPNLLSDSTELFMLASVNTAQEPNSVADADTSIEGALFGIVTFEHMVLGMRIVNAILVLTSILFCLTMIFSLKVSMLGRLGGINHITRAFFLSLLLLIFVLPWQRVFDSVIIGAIFTPVELVKGYEEKTSDLLDMVLYYLRFSGYMILVFLLLVMAQIRSSRWAKAILRRLEII